MSFYDKLKFDSNGLIPAIIQEQKTGRVVMMAWMNRASLEKTIETGKTHFWSRSRQKFWMKGEESGHTQTVKDIAFDCDGDTLLIQVDQIGAACHEGYQSCFFRSVEKDGQSFKITEAATRNAGADLRKEKVMDDTVPFASRDYCLLLLLLVFARGMDFLSTWIATPNLVLEGNPLAKKLGWQWGLLLNVVLVGVLALWPSVGHRRRHRQRAGGRAQFPIRVAHAFARRGNVPPMACRTRPGNAHHALPVLPGGQHAVDRRRWRGADLFQPPAAGAVRHRHGHGGLCGRRGVLYAAGDLAHPARGQKTGPAAKSQHEWQNLTADTWVRVENHAPDKII